MVKKFNTLYEYDYSSLNYENMKKFRFSQKDKKLISFIEDLCDEVKGLYVIGGQRGVGKSSLLEKAVLQIKEKDNKIIIHLTMPIIKDNLYYEILKKLVLHENLSDEDKNEINKLIFDYESETLKQEKHCNIDSNVDENSSLKVIDLPIWKILKLKKEKKKHNIIKSSKEVTLKVNQLNSKEQKNDNFLKLMKEISSKFKMIIIIDELDKVKVNSIGLFIEMHKQLFLSNSILTFLVCNKYDSLYLEENYSDYISDFLYCNNMEIKDFIIRCSSMEFSYRMDESILMFYQSAGNYRELIKIYNSKIEPEDSYCKSMMLYFFVNSHFYVSMEEKYKDILVDFYKYILEYIFLFNKINEEDFELIQNKFLKMKYEKVLHVSLLIKKCISVIKEGFSANGMRVLLIEYTENQKMVAEILNKTSSKKIHMFNETTKEFEKDKCIEVLKDLDDMISNFNDFNKDFIEVWKELYFNKIMERNTHEFNRIENMNIYIENRESQNSIDNAIKKLKMYQLDSVIGLILFEPFDRIIGNDRDAKPLYNGYIITKNGFDILALSYIGYPGLSSHKKFRCKELIEFVQQNKIPTIKIKNNEKLMRVWDKYFSDKKSLNLDDLLKESYLRDWIEKLMKIAYYKENLYEEEVECIAM